MFFFIVLGNGSVKMVLNFSYQGWEKKLRFTAKFRIKSVYRRLLDSLLKLNFSFLNSLRAVDDILLSIAMFFLHFFSSAYNSFSFKFVMANAIFLNLIR